MAMTDLLCFGETMSLVVPSHGGALTDEDLSLELHVGGAESNVACGVAHFGFRSEWWSRLGDDPFGRRILRELEQRGVDVSGVVIDTERPTGTYWKDPSDSGTAIYYYRAGSAASAMSPRDLASLRGRSRVVHLSGITAALSDSTRMMMERALIGRELAPATISFDVNYRPALWQRSDAAPALLDMSAAADIVIVGRDEAEELWDAVSAEDVRRLLPDVRMLVVKDADIGATCFRGEEAVFVPAFEVDIVEPVGAGDAFAAGFLAGLLKRLPIENSLRLGHVMASETLQHFGDLVDLDPPEMLLERARGVVVDGGSTTDVRRSERSRVVS